MTTVLLINTNPGAALAAMLIVSFLLGSALTLMITRIRRKRIIARDLENLIPGEISTRDQQIEALLKRVERQKEVINDRNGVIAAMRSSVISAMNQAHKTVIESATEQERWDEGR